MAQILAVRHFQSLINEKARMSGSPVADPFVVASAMTRRGVVVTEERKPENGARIPNVCEHFGVACVNLEGLMEREGWTF